MGADKDEFKNTLDRMGAKYTEDDFDHGSSISFDHHQDDTYSFGACFDKRGAFIEFSGSLTSGE